MCGWGERETEMRGRERGGDRKRRKEGGSEKGREEERRKGYLVSQWGQFQASANEKRGEDIGNSKLQLKALQFGQLNPIKKS